METATSFSQAQTSRAFGSYIQSPRMIPNTSFSQLQRTQTTEGGMGHVKLDAPARFSGGKIPGVRVWLTQMERYLRLSRANANDWLDMVAMRTDGAASAWINATFQEIDQGRRNPFASWSDFKAAMVKAFEPITATEEARKQLRGLRQTHKASGYIAKFRELQYKLPDMTQEEAFSAFLAGLSPHLQEHVGAHIQGDLEAAMAMAMRMDLYHGASKADAGKSTDKKKKGNVNVVDASDAQVNAVQKKGDGKKKNPKKRQKGRGKEKRGPPKCFCCEGEHLLKDCPEWKEMRNRGRSDQPQQQGNA